MVGVEVVVALCWAAFWAYWIVAAFSMKRARIPWSRELGLRVVLALAVLLLIRAGAFRADHVSTSPWRAGAGILLLVVGLGFAVWARVHIGANWGPPMSQKDDPELVTTGPYRLVRHPIYSGILLAGLGTAVALSWTWLPVVLLVGIYFGYAATVEERYLAQRDPDAYAAYKHASKMLVPGVF